MFKLFDQLFYISDFNMDTKWDEQNIYIYICLMRLNVLSGAMCQRKIGQRSQTLKPFHIYIRGP